MSEELKNTTAEHTPQKKYHRRFFTVKRIILLSILGDIQYAPRAL